MRGLIFSVSSILTIGGIASLFYLGSWIMGIGIPVVIFLLAWLSFLLSRGTTSTSPQPSHF